MHLEYFQLIDRIVDLNVGERTITVEAQVPEHNTIFEGHFPAHPIMPGVLLIEAMAQTSGWLFVRATKSQPDVCAIASISNTPGMIGWAGKWPSKMVLCSGTCASTVMVRSPTLRSTMRSISWKYSRCMAGG